MKRPTKRKSALEVLKNTPAAPAQSACLVLLDDTKEYIIDALVCTKMLSGVQQYQVTFKTTDYLVLDRLKGIVLVYPLKIEETFKALLRSFQEGCAVDGYSSTRAQEIKKDVDSALCMEGKYKYNEYYYQKVIHIISEGRFSFLSIRAPHLS